MIKIISFIFIFSAFSAFASVELNCGDAFALNNKEELVRIQFRRLDLFAPIDQNTEVLAMGSPDNPHWRQLGVASFYIEQYQKIGENFKGPKLHEEIYKVRLRGEDYVIEKLRLPSSIVTTTCIKTTYTGNDL